MHLNAAKTIIGGLWGAVGVGGQALLQLAVLMVLARQLTPADYGLANTAVIVLLFAKMLFELGIGQALVQKPEVSERDFHTASTMAIVLGVAGATTFILISKPIAVLFRMPMLEEIFPFYSFVFVLRGVSLASEAKLLRNLQFRLLAGLEALSYTLGYAGFGISMALYGMGVWSLVGAHVSQELLKTIGLWAFSPPQYARKLRLQPVRQLLRFGVGQSYAQVASYAANQGDTLIVAKLLGEHAVGIYGRTYQLVVMPFNLLGRAIDKVLFPVLAHFQHDGARLARNFKRSLSLITIVGFPISLLLVVLAQEIVHCVLGDRWNSVILPFQIMATGLFFRTSYKVCDALVKATGAVYWRAAIQTIYAAVVLLGAMVAAQWGISAVAFVAQVALVANFIFMFGLACRLATSSWIQMCRSFLPGLLIGAVTSLSALALVSLLRHYQSPDVVTIAVVVLLTLVFAGATLWGCRNWMLAEDAAWFLRELVSGLPNFARVGFDRLLRSKTYNGEQ